MRKKHGKKKKKKKKQKKKKRRRSPSSIENTRQLITCRTAQYTNNETVYS